MRLTCWLCKKSVTTNVPDNTVFRGIAICPECTKDEALTRDDRQGIDYTLQGKEAWITAGNVSVWLRKTKTRVIVELYRHKKEMCNRLDIATATQIPDKE